MKTAEIIQRVQSLYSKGAASDDSRLTDRHIYHKLVTLRSKYLTQQANKKQKMNQWNFQTLPCVALEKVSIYSYHCPCVPPMGCDILKSKYPLPKPLTNLNKHLIQSVSTIDGSVLFNEIAWENVKYKASNKYTAKKPDYFIKDGYLFIVGLTQRMRHLKWITVTGLFEDPIEVQRFPSGCRGEEEEVTPCLSPLDSDFAVDMTFVDWIVNEASQELIQFFNTGREDTTNDNRDHNG